MTGPQPSDSERQLLRLLALKRHEVPPPRFFDELPNRILRTLHGQVESESRSWWDRLCSLVGGEPMVAGSYAALGLGALLFGVSVFETARSAGDPAPVALQGTYTGASPLLDPLSSSLPPGVVYRVIPVGQSSQWMPGEAYTVRPVSRFLDPEDIHPAATLVRFSR